MQINTRYLWMNIRLREESEVIEMICEELNQHGLEGWTAELNSKLTTSAGKCSYKNKKIILSTEFALRCHPADLQNTIIHEIAHALTPGASHGTKWKNKMKELGEQPDRTHTQEWRIPDAWLYCTKCKLEYTKTFKQLSKYQISPAPIGGEYLSGQVLDKKCASIGLSKACGEDTLRIHVDKPSDRFKPRNHWTQIDHKTDYELEPAPEPIAEPDPIRCPRVSVFPSTIVQPSFLDDVPVMTFEREPGKATFIHDKSKQLSLFE